MCHLVCGYGKRCCGGRGCQHCCPGEEGPDSFLVNDIPAVGDVELDVPLAARHQKELQSSKSDDSSNRDPEAVAEKKAKKKAERKAEKKAKARSKALSLNALSKFLEVESPIVNVLNALKEGLEVNALNAAPPASKQQHAVGQELRCLSTAKTLRLEQELEAVAKKTSGQDLNSSEVKAKLKEKVAGNEIWDRSMTTIDADGSVPLHKLLEKKKALDEVKHLTRKAELGADSEKCSRRYTPRLLKNAGMHDLGEYAPDGTTFTGTSKVANEGIQQCPPKLKQAFSTSRLCEQDSQKSEFGHLEGS
eukprot:gnl/TRDRNA2_/TRDRNA2_80833_c0_seq1.p1 gnl/TRDRNA2_/TRDRNA2_80833_c0~~gnl/TRDRNA2_/TRDRNA2_80833_c0_seq1.p1  ORF type:complete len:305 (+),score=73.12 gnl/TRDRNA2_/TRDRNA2_80833_c0_seq1:102-1016(+)